MLAWLAEFFDLIISFVPRWIKIRATHAGVLWRFCGDPQELRPGIRFVWPIFDEYEIVVVARQTDPLPPQSLTLSDGASVAVKGMTIYCIEDVVAAYGKRNWDITSTVNDLSMYAISDVVGKLKTEDLQDLETVSNKITARVRELSAEYGIRVERCGLVEAVVARTHRHLGVEITCVGSA